MPAKKTKAATKTAARSSVKSAPKAKKVKSPTPPPAAAVQASTAMIGADTGATTVAASSATGSTLSASTLKNFRHHPDMENFFRFVYENDLRFEALTILDQMLKEKTLRKKLRAARNKAH